MELLSLRLFFFNFYFVFYPCLVLSLLKQEYLIIDKLNEDNLINLSKIIIPPLGGKSKGESGKIGVIGGSTEYTGAPYFAAISALKNGADLVYVITTESAAPIIKVYSPDLIVYPFLKATSYIKNSLQINSLLFKMDAIVLGPGLGREDEILEVIYGVIETCKNLKKPLVIDADGLYAVAKNLSVIKNYPSPGVILTPNQKEARRLSQSISSNNSNWYNYWGDYVNVLVKGEEDKFYSSISSFEWSLSKGGSGRRAGGQGDILSGALGTFYNWALNSNISENRNPVQLAQSIAAYAAAKVTRTCNSRSYATHGRSMTASNMLNEIHFAFNDIFI